jgi:hypothetical protein
MVTGSNYNGDWHQHQPPSCQHSLAVQHVIYLNDVLAVWTALKLNDVLAVIG